MNFGGGRRGRPSGRCHVSFWECIFFCNLCPILWGGDPKICLALFDLCCFVLGPTKYGRFQK